MNHLTQDWQQFPNLTLQEKNIAGKVSQGKRLSMDEGEVLFNSSNLGFLGMLAQQVRLNRHSDAAYFNRNFHIEPTNKCVFTCKFCSYSRLIQQEDESWTLTEEQMLDIVRRYVGTDVTEVHIVGGVHPKMNLMFFAGLIKKIKEIMPAIHVKAFTAVELEYMFRKAKVNVEQGLRILKEHGLDSLPGGGAEIFNSSVRDQICKDKADAQQWLEIHETAHRLGLPSNCTMLYGHVETYRHRLEHMAELRDLQDGTSGFNTFIPLKFRNGGNEMSHLPEVTLIEDLKNYAVSRIFLDNIPHLKAYWPMLGRENAQLSLSFGVDDLDGTIDDSTKIYSMAGSEEQNPAMTTAELVELIRTAGFRPVERDTLYNVMRDYSASAPVSNLNDLPVLS